MNFMWEMTLNAKDNSISKYDVFYKVSKDISPWYEQSLPYINQKKITNPNIELNPLYRFDYIFGKMLAPELEELNEFKEYFFDISTHFLCDVDMYAGLTKKDIYLIKLKKEFIEFNENQTIIFNNFNKKQQESIMVFLLSQIQTGSQISIFRQLIITIYKNSLMYQLIDEPNTILLYLSIAKTTESNEKIDLLIELFVPLSFNIRVFWKDHFGVIGVDSTMILNQIELF